MLAVSSTSRQGKAMTAPHSFQIVGFDLDGTIVDSSFELAASLNHALETGGRSPIAAEDVKQLVGMGARHMLELLYSFTHNFT